MDPVKIIDAATEADDIAFHEAGTCHWDCWICEHEATEEQNAHDPMNFQ